MARKFPFHAVPVGSFAGVFDCLRVDGYPEDVYQGVDSVAEGVSVVARGRPDPVRVQLGSEVLWVDPTGDVEAQVARPRRKPPRRPSVLGGRGSAPLAAARGGRAGRPRSTPAETREVKADVFRFAVRLLGGPAAVLGTIQARQAGRVDETAAAWVRLTIAETAPHPSPQRGGRVQLNLGDGSRKAVRAGLLRVAFDGAGGLNATLRWVRTAEATGRLTAKAADWVRAAVADARRP